MVQMVPASKNTEGSLHHSMEVDFQRQSQTACWGCYLLKLKWSRLTLKNNNAAKAEHGSEKDFKTLRITADKVVCMPRKLPGQNPNLSTWTDPGVSVSWLTLSVAISLQSPQPAGEAHPSIPRHPTMTSIDKSRSKRGDKVILSPSHCVTWESAVTYVEVSLKCRSAVIDIQGRRIVKRLLCSSSRQM